jgi:hypothetical protein
MIPLTNPSEQLPQAFARTASTKQFPARKMRSFTVMALGITALVSTGARDGRAAIFTMDETTIAAFGTVNQNNVPPGNGALSCAPTATMNSFTFLQNAYPTVYGLDGGGAPVLQGGQGSWQAAAALLAGPLYMATSATTGTTEGNWVNGKVNYLTTYAPGTTTFAGMDSDATVNRPVWDQNANPTVNFLLQQLQTGEDVELGIDPTGNGIGHVMTLTGLTWNDANNNGLFDASDTLTLNTIDPANPGVNTPLTLNPGNAMSITGANYNTYLLTGALAESPVPEPTTVSLALLGGAAIAFFRNRHTKV